MRSLRVGLCTVLLAVSVQGYNFSYHGWTMAGADEVSAVEGGSAVLPCTFTHPPTDRPLTGSVMWHRGRSNPGTLVFNCTYPGPNQSWCNDTVQEAGGGRFRFVGNLTQRDASIMVERLNQRDHGWYQCRVELNIGNFETVFRTKLTVRAPGGNVSVVTGNEGGSATLPCVFTPPQDYPVPHTVTWMRKDPYRHIVTFRPQTDGSWAAENGTTRYELVGDPEQGNTSTRIKQLSVEDNHGYLCLVEFRKKADYRYPSNGWNITSPSIHLSQCEIRLRVTTVNSKFPTIYLVVVLVLLFLLLMVIGTLLKKGVHLWLMGCMRGTKRNDPSSSRTDKMEQKQPQSAPEQGSTYSNVVMKSSEKGAKRSPVSDPQEPEANSCTYASLVIGGPKAKPPQANDGDVIYAAVVTR